MAENLLDKQEKPAAELERDLILWLVDPDGSGDRDYWTKLRSLEQFLGTGTVGVEQTAHGFDVGDVISHDGADYVEATADTEANARAVAVVVDVPDADSFLLRSGGFVTGLSGLTGGSWHYLQDGGGLGTTAGTIKVPVLLALSSTEAWLLPLGFPPPDRVYDMVLGFAGTPGSDALDWIVTGRACTISASDPGEAYARTNPTDGSWDFDIRKNGTSVGTLTVATDGSISWSVASDINLSGGDRLELVAPSTADTNGADVQAAFKAVVD